MKMSFFLATLSSNTFDESEKNKNRSLCEAPVIYVFHLANDWKFNQNQRFSPIRRIESKNWLCSFRILVAEIQRIRPYSWTKINSPVIFLLYAQQNNMRRDARFSIPPFINMMKNRACVKRSKPHAERTRRRRSLQPNQRKHHKNAYDLLWLRCGSADSTHVRVRIACHAAHGMRCMNLGYDQQRIEGEPSCRCGECFTKRKRERPNRRRLAHTIDQRRMCETSQPKIPTIPPHCPRSHTALTRIHTSYSIHAHIAPQPLATLTHTRAHGDHLKYHRKV